MTAEYVTKARKINTTSLCLDSWSCGRATAKSMPLCCPDFLNKLSGNWGKAGGQGEQAGQSTWVSPRAWLGQEGRSWKDHPN